MHVSTGMASTIYRLPVIIICKEYYNHASFQSEITWFHTVIDNNQPIVWSIHVRNVHIQLKINSQMFQSLHDTQSGFCNKPTAQQKAKQTRYSISYNFPDDIHLAPSGFICGMKLRYPQPLEPVEADGETIFRGKVDRKQTARLVHTFQDTFWTLSEENR